MDGDRLCNAFWSPESKQTEKEPPNNNGPDSLKQRRDGGEENGGEVVEGFRELKP